MPWTEDDVDRFCRGLTARQRRAWVKVANGVLEDGKADGDAIRMANVAARRVAPEDVHGHHHDLIEARFAAWARAPKRSGADKLRRRRLAKDAWWTLSGHMKGKHGLAGRPGAGGGPWVDPLFGKTYDEVAAWHDRLHAAEREEG